jgi:hypothetical protein
MIRCNDLAVPKRDKLAEWAPPTESPKRITHIHLGAELGQSMAVFVFIMHTLIQVQPLPATDSSEGINVQTSILNFQRLAENKFISVSL